MPFNGLPLLFLVLLFTPIYPIEEKKMSSETKKNYLPLIMLILIFGIPFLVIWYILNLKLIKYKYNEETFSNFAFTMFTIQIIAVVLLIVLNNL